ncbi:MAG: hypothetical protein IJJ15_03610 [Ruminococcus sp.]|nr:hypothetical protein [Ruminococcus sp.]
MKRILIAFLIILCLLLCSCAKTPTLSGNISETAEVSLRDETYSVRIESVDDGSVIITMLSPKNISGISYHYQEDQLTVEYEKLRCITDIAYLPQGAVPCALYEAVTAIPEAQYQSSQDGEDVFSCADGRFSVKAKDGKISEICDTKYGYVFSFYQSG